MFRWAVCQLDTLRKCRNRAMLRQTLATLPSTPDQTYDRILCSISEEDTTYALRILQWLTFSTRPLAVDEIAKVIAIDLTRDPVIDRDQVLEEPLEVLNICSSLVSCISYSGPSWDLKLSENSSKYRDDSTSNKLSDDSVLKENNSKERMVP
ncbi:hypothetical protein FB567DRAFT_539530 [Paraphoma chrysanthemicola]|uniref:GPI inositol-deacylase winged helix domain-containing protein n=1 Tax=Paraphoma chrysanthemicola TaxID=798071 RepID=A0A8K0VT05_9PLEO|nr:hypothetical protein FB567DRAFT_539530 [Paraphoma chrysanthemicola]